VCADHWSKYVQCLFRWLSTYQSAGVDVDECSPVACVEGLIAAGHLAFVGLYLRVDADVDLQAVRGEEGLLTSVFRAFEAVVAWKAEKQCITWSI